MKPIFGGFETRLKFIKFGLIGQKFCRQYLNNLKGCKVIRQQQIKGIFRPSAIVFQKRNILFVNGVFWFFFYKLLLANYLNFYNSVFESRLFFNSFILFSFSTVNFFCQKRLICFVNDLKINGFSCSLTNSSVNFRIWSFHYRYFAQPYRWS